MNKDLEKLSHRQNEIAKSIEALQREAEELVIARKVFARLNVHAMSNGSKKADAKGAPRPKGTPTIFEMVESVLEDAENSGNDGLFSGELIAAIEEKFWPGLKSRQILPTVYGFVKSKRLHKTEGGRFKRLKTAQK